MALTPGEHDRLLLFTQAQLARARASRGLKLNIPEATALIADSVCEWARDGKSLPEARALAQGLLSASDVLEEVPEILTQILVEARFDDGTRLVVVRNPFGIGAPAGDNRTLFVPAEHGRVEVTNTASTAIGITSHIHMAEVNPRLRLDRAAAYGMRPAHATGVTVWLEAGESVSVPLTPIEGERIIIGNTGVINGPLDDPEVRARALATLRECGYLDIVGGHQVNNRQRADGAVARLMGSQ